MFLRHPGLTGVRRFSREHGRILKLKGARDGSSDAILHKRGPPPRNENHVIDTLDPNKFSQKKQKPLHIGDLQSILPYVSLLKQSRLVQVPAMDYDNSVNAVIAHPPYPLGTKAFLYYLTLPGKPRIAGELRLRVTQSDEPESFKSGSDLLRTDGQPWSRLLYALPKYYTPLYEKLKEEKLVPDDLDRSLSTLPMKRLRYRSPKQRLYTLNDTFIVDFSKAVNFLVITEKGVETIRFIKLFYDSRREWANRPYTGSALARFERSTLQGHEGTRTIVIRFLKIVAPVKPLDLYDGMISFPEEGELFRRRSRYTLKLDNAVWSINIDSDDKRHAPSLIRGFQLLWDTST